jgi:hypothetical protein
LNEKKFSNQSFKKMKITKKNIVGFFYILPHNTLVLFCLVIHDVLPHNTLVMAGIYKKNLIIPKSIFLEFSHKLIKASTSQERQTIRILFSALFSNKLLQCIMVAASFDSHRSISAMTVPSLTGHSYSLAMLLSDFSKGG